MNKATDENIKTGAKLKLFIDDDNPNNTELEIRAIVDESHVVYRVYSENKQRMIYCIDHLSLFSMYINSGWLFICDT